MRNVLFHLFIALALEAVVRSFQGSILAAEYDANENDQDAEEEDDSDNDDGEPKRKEKTRAEDTPKRVRSIVDSLLKINKRIDPAIINARAQTSSNGRGIDKQQIDGVKSRANNKREPIKARSAVSSKKRGGKKKSNREYKGGSFKKFSPSSYREVYTVKNINATARSNFSYGYQTRIYEKSWPFPERSYAPLAKNDASKVERKIEYKIKTFGGEGSKKSVEESFPDDKLTVKSKNYFRQKSSCGASNGCSGI